MAEDALKNCDMRFSSWLEYVHEVVRAVDSGTRIPLGPSREAMRPPIPPASAQAVKIVYCSPHPDDESLTGAMALRLRLQGAWVTNVAVTLGSDRKQRTRRLAELESACRVLGFKLVVPVTPSGSCGFDDVNTKSKLADPAKWTEKVRVLAEIFEQEQPDVVFAPHSKDFNSTHVGTYFLVVEALSVHLEHSGRGMLLLIQTEFWHQLYLPNLMVGLTPELVALQLTAAAEHGGEMSRNPYHLRHACRLMDNVRRGSEVVGGQGASVQEFTFAELYRVTFIRGGQVLDPNATGRIIAPDEPIEIEALLDEFRPG